MDSAAATCLKAAIVPSVVPIQWTKSVISSAPLSFKRPESTSAVPLGSCL